jgi:hypothetical protein
MKAVSQPCPKMFPWIGDLQRASQIWAAFRLSGKKDFLKFIFLKKGKENK